MAKLIARFSLPLAVMLTAGCATIDFDYPKTESFALTDTADTPLGRQVAEFVAARPENESGFYPVYDGIDSLAIRLIMAERAERSIDAQYFLIHDDLVGNVFINALLKAANRGVRVRLLVDDINAKGYDAGFAALDSHENFELRIFNPFGHRKFRALDVTSLSRVSRRMHNKSFTVDNQMTLIGGRNIADEYFDARKDEKFADLDVLAIGSVVQKVSSMFDSYWNHGAALPMPAIAEVPDNADEALATLHERVAVKLEEEDSAVYADAVRNSVLDYVGTDATAFHWAEYDVVYDSPDKSNPDAGADADSIGVEMRESIGEVQEEMFVVTPYFVLAKDNIEGFRGLRDRGVAVTVTTNSLASNNHSVSHSGYAPNRKRLLQMGVNLYEVRASTTIPATEHEGVQEAKTTLHAKVFSVDRKKIFIGSFNWNQRSVNLDTELGVIIHSPELATAMVERVIAGRSQHSFQLFLNEDGDLRWRGYDDGQEIILTEEPQTSFWHRFNANVLRIAPNSQL